MNCKHCNGKIESDRQRCGKKFCRKCDSFTPRPSFTPIYDFYVEDASRTRPGPTGEPYLAPLIHGILCKQKGAVIERYAKLNGCTILIETGTANGQTVDLLKNTFSEIHSIELGDGFFQNAQMRFNKYPHIHIHHGDSGQVLKSIMQGIATPAIFWLDAHYSGGQTVCGEKETPIMEELDAIYKAAPLQHVILIDDRTEFGRNPAYPTIKALTDYIHVKNPKALIELLPENIIAITPTARKKSQVIYEQSLSCQIVTLKSILQAEFQGKTDGIFVDVGANDGYFCSNVWGLAQAGWRGICFEPVPDMAAKCRERYADKTGVVIIEAAVGSYDGLAKLFLGVCPTINEETVKKNAWGFGYDPANSLLVPVVTLNTSLAQLSIPKKFDLLSIDVEGAELEVLDGIDFKVWKPRMVILETAKTHENPAYHIHTEEIGRRMLAEGFREVYYDAINSIYVRAQ